MSLNSELTRLQTAKASIKTSIENKGFVVGNGTIDTYASIINEIALDMSVVKLTNSSFTTLPILIADADWSNVSNFAGMFNTCVNLTTLPELDLSGATNINTIVRNCILLENLGGFKNLGQAYETSASANYNNYKLDFTTCNNITHDSLVNVINDLYDIATKGCNAQQLFLGSLNLSKLTAEEIAIATNKGWTVS